MYLTIFNYLPILLVFTEARGPHHPRGEKIVKRHVHYKPSKETNEKLTEDVQLLHDKEHLQEHLEDVIPDPDFSKMTDEELEFYYFQVHDTDKNSKLDGLEILQAIIHTDEHNDAEGNDGNHVSSTQSSDLSYYIELIDQVLEEDDADHDGYLSYSEYVARRRNQYKNIEVARSPGVKIV
nr:multiple coagulation factor deficiency protein 2 homolog isoform X1 [Leptinotarsa decemlineata]XP_023029876.1 multiple coagulation factor deficiency protein 2 homolog isoform X1 [Leptinotarsa decemlineata]